MLSDTERHSASDPVFATKRFRAAEIGVAVASQAVWDPVHVRDTIIRTVSSRGLSPVIPVGVDAALVIQPLSALPFEAHLWNYENIISRFGESILTSTARDKKSD